MCSTFLFPILFSFVCTILTADPTIEDARAFVLQLQQLWNTTQFADLFRDDLDYYFNFTTYTKKTFIARCLKEGPGYLKRDVHTAEWKGDRLLYSTCGTDKGLNYIQDGLLSVLGNNKYQLFAAQEAVVPDFRGYCR